MPHVFSAVCFPSMSIITGFSMIHRAFMAYISMELPVLHHYLKIPVPIIFIYPRIIEEVVPDNPIEREKSFREIFNDFLEVCSTERSWLTTTPIQAVA